MAVPNILTLEETCKVLKVGRTKLQKILLNDPTFPGIHDGPKCKWWINGDQIERWWNQKYQQKLNNERQELKLVSGGER